MTNPFDSQPDPAWDYATTWEDLGKIQNQLINLARILIEHETASEEVDAQVIERLKYIQGLTVEAWRKLK